MEACVQHAADQGFIDNQGIANSLLTKLNATQAAFDRGQTEVTIKNLEAFTHEVQAQAGKPIAQMHAEHMVMHAQMAIQALKNK